MSNDSTAWSKIVIGVKRSYVWTLRNTKECGDREKLPKDNYLKQSLKNMSATPLFLLYYMLQPHLHLLSSGVHHLSDKVYGCRFPAHMDLLCTETYTNTKKTSTAEVENIVIK